jgi:hypothetical protein
MRLSGHINTQIAAQRMVAPEILVAGIFWEDNDR